MTGKRKFDVRLINVEVALETGSLSLLGVDIRFFWFAFVFFFFLALLVNSSFCGDAAAVYQCWGLL